jgi:hypothetical protein
MTGSKMSVAPTEVDHDMTASADTAIAFGHMFGILPAFRERRPRPTQRSQSNHRSQQKSDQGFPALGRISWPALPAALAFLGSGFGGSFRQRGRIGTASAC